MTTGWDAIQKAAEHQQRRIMDAIGRHVSHTLLARSMDEGLALSGYDQLIRGESYAAGMADAAKGPRRELTAVDRVRLENEAAARSAQEFEPHDLGPNPEGPQG